MTETGYFFMGLSVCSFIVFGVIAIIHKRFRLMMVDLCEGEARADFWTLAVEAWFFLYSISSALKWHPEGITERQLFFASITQIKEGLNEMSNAIVMFSIGLLVFVFIRRIKGRENEIVGRGKI